MPLRYVLLWILAITSLVFLHLFAIQNLTGRRFRKGTAPILVAGVILFLLVFCIWGRSLSFGVDTAGYAKIFADYCNGHSMDDAELSYFIAMWLLNAAMFGACNVDWMPGAWGLLVVAPLLAMREPLPLRLSFAAVLIFSLVGIDLSTNALRQGVSVSVCMLAISAVRRNCVVGLPLAIMSVLLHTSTLLVFTALVFALLPWRLFVLTLVSSITIVMQSLQYGYESEFLQPLLYEVQKYLAHESDDIWVRVLAFACVVAALVCPWLIRLHLDSKLLTDKNYKIALRLTVACLPFLTLPYFGYRILYGIYPLVLYYTLLSGCRTATPNGRHLALLIILNAMVLLVWSQGSNAMRDLAFFD